LRGHKGHDADGRSFQNNGPAHLVGKRWHWKCKIRKGKVRIRASC
jgi:hypothetical protein